MKTNKKKGIVSLSFLIMTFICLYFNTQTETASMEITCKDGSVMILIPAGEFVMGSPEGAGDTDETPPHTVYLDAYYIDKYEVTVGQYRKFCQETRQPMPCAPNWEQTDSHPIVNITWEEASAYAQYYGKRLPTEAEWEKACRAGSNTKYSFGDEDSQLWEYAWYEANSEKKTYPVGQKKPNAYGLYDMHGNAWEWCSDFYRADYYTGSPAANPQGPASGRHHAMRGGSWFNNPSHCRCAYRDWQEPDYWYGPFGFRCAISAPAPQ
ncbi:MAG: formylglycine-generating enzyme family protein [Candidatus Omnitrophica bacterium]|nr:formylglycine-generating enzyme family protein [Candidatus Omnitrophota bacterium]